MQFIHQMGCRLESDNRLEMVHSSAQKKSAYHCGHVKLILPRIKSYSLTKKERERDGEENSESSRIVDCFIATIQSLLNCNIIKNGDRSHERSLKSNKIAFAKRNRL